jgi:hypothetical protein
MAGLLDRLLGRRPPRRRVKPNRGPSAGGGQGGAPPLRGGEDFSGGGDTVDLTRRRDQLSARVAELQFDLGGMVYEMAIRDQIRVEVIVQRAAALQEADAELAEVERILRLEETSTAGVCRTCAAPHSSGAAYCWQCGQPLLEQSPSAAIAAS